LGQDRLRREIDVWVVTLGYIDQCVGVKE